MRLMIIGSLDGQIGAASQIAIGRGAKVTQVPDIGAALEALRSGDGAELLMIDVKLDIESLTASLLAERITVPVVACGVGADPREAVRAIKAGAKEFVPLPPDPELIAAVFEAVSAEDNAMIVRDPAMERVVKLAEQIAPSEATVLITGESGTGKEVMARLLHRKSRRKDEKFISVNCAAIPENLLESELFGHEKGAFTGAVARRVGKFEEADGGTLLLDEISEMDPRLQAKLLRVIQERELDRVGGAKPVKVDIRLIATSNRNLEEEVRKGNFREDLYFRLNVVNLRLPSLRERPADIEALAEHFVAKYAKANGVPERPLSKEAAAQLRAYAWPGNVRELENTMHRAVLLAQGPEIGPEAVVLADGSALGMSAGAANQAAKADTAAASAPDHGGEAGGAVDSNGRPTRELVGRTVAEVERELIIDTISHCLGNRTHAANILGISIRTLRNKLKQYAEDGVHVPAPGDFERHGAL